MPLTQGAQADRIELKNLAKQALAQLDAAGVPKRQVWPIESAVDAIAEVKAALRAEGHEVR